MFVLLLASVLINVQFTKFDSYKKCVSEKTESEFCNDTKSYIEFKKIHYADLGD